MTDSYEATALDVTFTVTVGTEPGEEETIIDGAVAYAATPPILWIDKVLFGTEWHDAVDVFTQGFCETLADSLLPLFPGYVVAES